MPSKPSATIAELTGGRRPNFGPTGLQDAHIVGEGFYNGFLNWLRVLLDSDEDVNFVVLPESERGNAILGVSSHFQSHNTAFDRFF